MEILKPLVKQSLRAGKPPVKADIISLQKTHSALASLPSVKIKHQIWALAQAEKLKSKQMMKTEAVNIVKH